MTNAKSTKRALLSSVIALFLCFSMLLGTTFAWFTDSVTSAGNKIQAGTLDVQLWQHTAAGSTEITDESAPLFGGDIIWEPGKTQVVYLSIKNNGTLALKYKVAIDVTNVTGNLHEAMKYAITPDAEYGDVTAWAGNGVSVVPGTNVTQANDVKLLPGGEHFFALSVHMDEEAGNEYMGKSISFDIRVLAGQVMEENDSFDNTYDELAGYPNKGYAALPAPGETAVELELKDTSDNKVGTILIPAAAKESEGATGYFADIKLGNYTPSVTIAAGMETLKCDITVAGLAADNTEPVRVTLKIAAGLDPATVKLYHYDTEIDCTYDPNTGYVIFYTATFSPFTIVFDAESEYVPPVEPSMERPTATVTYAPEYVGEGKVQWGSYGQWSPTEGLDSDLEAAFVFSCPDYDSATDEVKAVIDAYRYWYCDFYVSLDRDLGENQIFLGGYYANFGAYVGFHNGEVTLAANEELPLLGSVTQSPWTYDNIENSVSEFMCGVGHVGTALDGATFTVKLRLTNPENEAEFYDVNVVTYTFGGDYTIS